MPIVREHLKNSLQIILMKCCYQLIEVGGLRGSAEPRLLQIQNIGDRRTEREKHFPETLRAEETLACMQNRSGENVANTSDQCPKHCQNMQNAQH